MLLPRSQNPLLALFSEWSWWLRLRED
ncbi:unnamed protein product [Calypogeia fissa]